MLDLVNGVRCTIAYVTPKPDAVKIISFEALLRLSQPSRTSRWRHMAFDIMRWLYCRLSEPAEFRAEDVVSKSLYRSLQLSSLPDPESRGWLTNNGGKSHPGGIVLDQLAGCLAT